MRETGTSAISIGRQGKSNSQASVDRRRFALGPGSGRNRGCGMVGTREGNREDKREEDATLNRRDKHHARSFAVGGHWLRRVRHNRTRQRHTWLSYTPCPRIAFQGSATRSTLTLTLPRHFAPAFELFELSVLIHLVSSIHPKSRASSKRDPIPPSSRPFLLAFVPLHLLSRGLDPNTTKCREPCKYP